MIDPATGLPVAVAPYDETTMHIDQTNIIGNAEDFEGVDPEPRSHDFQASPHVFGDITRAHTNKSVMMASPPRITKKLTATQQRHRNQALGKLSTPANPFVSRGVDSTRKLFSQTKLV